MHGRQFETCQNKQHFFKSSIATFLICIEHFGKSFCSGSGISLLPNMYCICTYFMLAYFALVSITSEQNKNEAWESPAII